MCSHYDNVCLTGTDNNDTTKLFCDATTLTKRSGRNFKTKTVNTTASQQKTDQSGAKALKLDFAKYITADTMNTSTATKTKPLSTTNNLLELQLQQQSLQQQQEHQYQVLVKTATNRKKTTV